MNKRLERIIEKFREVNCYDMELVLTPETTLRAIGFDSLERADLAVAIEEEFGIRIDIAEFDGDITLGQLDKIVSMTDVQDDGFVDLGLTSGTLWAKENAVRGDQKLFTFDEAIGLFGDKMPTAAQIVELATECKSEWIEENGKVGRKFTGPNGNSIFIPADGYIWDDRLRCVGEEGNVWSKTPNVNFSAASACYLGFGSGYVYPLNYGYRAFGFSVRPVR